MKSNQVIDALGALAQETRLAIFRELVKAEEACCPGEGGLAVGTLLERLGVAAPTLSFHLKEMTHAGLVTSKREGRSIIYSANLKTMQGVLDFLMAECCGGGADVKIAARRKKTT